MVIIAALVVAVVIARIDGGPAASFAAITTSARTTHTVAIVRASRVDSGNLTADALPLGCLNDRSELSADQLRTARQQSGCAVDARAGSASPERRQVSAGLQRQRPATLSPSYGNSRKLPAAAVASSPRRPFSNRGSRSNAPARTRLPPRARGPGVPARRQDHRPSAPASQPPPRPRSPTGNPTRPRPAGRRNSRLRPPPQQPPPQQPPGDRALPATTTCPCP